MADVKRILSRHSSLKSSRGVWDNQFQLQGEYINLKRTAFTTSSLQSEFLNGSLFDSTATYVQETAASAILGYMWPNGGGSFVMVPGKDFKKDQQAKDWFAYVTETMRDLMNDDKAGLETSLAEVMEDVLSPCTGFLACLDDGDTDPNNPLLYETWSLDECWVWAGKGGKVGGIHRERRFKVSEFVDEYGLEESPKWVQEHYNNGKMDEEVVVLIAIEKRLRRDVTKKGAKNMPYSSTHIEMKTHKLMKESGFEEFPIMVVRMRKKSNEVYGRGFGFAALPIAMELNTIWEASTIYTEKRLDPPLVVLDNGTMGGGTVDTSAGAINTFRVTGRAGNNESPVRPIYDVGEDSSVDKLIERLTQQIYQMGMLDRLLNSMDDKPMTLGEAQIRDSRSNRATISPVKRITAELFTPMIERTFNILYRRNKFGYVRGSIEARLAEARGEKNIRYIPDSIIKAGQAGVQAYTIRYLSPAARLGYADEAQGIRQTTQDAAGLEAMFPGISKRLDPDFIIERLNQINGGPSEIFRADTKVKSERDAAAASVAESVGLDKANVTADTALKGAKAAQAARAAQGGA